MFIQYYYSLGDAGSAAEQQLADVLRLVLSADPDDDPITARGAADEERVREILGVAHKAASDGESLSIEERGDVSVDLGPDGVVSAFEDSAPPGCPGCYASLTDWDPDEWITTGEEPEVTCPDCGFTGPIGAWDLTRTLYARTDCALVLIDWPALDEYGPQLHDALLATVGSRPRYTVGRL